MRPLILTVTLNPAVDKAVCVDRFQLGRTHRTGAVYMDAGGKGINVSLALKKLGVGSVATGFAGGINGEFLKKDMDRAGIRHRFVDIKTGETRMSLTVLSRVKPHITRILEFGPGVDRQDKQRFIRTFTSLLKNCRYVVLSGRNIPGAGDPFCARLLNIARQHGKRTVLDTSGRSLALGLKAKPFLVKPNREEAEYVLKRKLNSQAKLKKGVNDLLAKGAQTVIISLGRQGAVASEGNGIFWVRPPQYKPLNSVGCGDAFLAGYLSAAIKGQSFERSLAVAAASGTANVFSMYAGEITKVQVNRLLKRTRVIRID